MEINAGDQVGSGERVLSSKLVFAKSWGIIIGVPALFLSAYLYPTIPYISGIGLCSFRRLTGFFCPGCGLKSSFIALARFNLRESVDVHPLGIVIALWLIYMMMRQLWALIASRTPRELLTQRQRDWLIYAFLFALMSNWIFGLILRGISS